MSLPHQWIFLSPVERILLPEFWLKYSNRFLILHLWTCGQWILFYACTWTNKVNVWGIRIFLIFFLKRIRISIYKSCIGIFVASGFYNSQPTQPQFRSQHWFLFFCQAQKRFDLSRPILQEFYWLSIYFFSKIKIGKNRQKCSKDRRNWFLRVPSVDCDFS